MRDQVTTLESAVELVGDGARLGVGGVLLERKPVALLAMLARQRRDLRLFSFLASIDAELLAVRGALTEAHTGYVGFEQLGRAPGYAQAVASGLASAHEYSELLFVTGLRAAAAGLPFLPTRGAEGSDLLAELQLAEVRCPYTGESLRAVPAMWLDVAVLHAVAADRHGTVLAPAEPGFLYDADATLARAADTVIVTVERVVDTEQVRDCRHRTLLYPHEVHAVVPVPGGACPTAVPERYTARIAALRNYLAEPSPGGLDVLADRAGVDGE